MAAGEEVVALLKSIDASLKTLVARSKTAAPKEVAPDSDLDGAYGDPIIKAADPRDWTGPSQKGKRFSECSSEYLMLVADRLDYFAEKAEQEGTLTSNGKPVAPFNRRDAARARGWAKRLREGWRTPLTQSEFPATRTGADANGSSDFGADDIPF